MSRKSVPYVAERYVYSQLFGEDEEFSRREDEEDEQSEVDRSIRTLRPKHGLFKRHSDAHSEAREATEILAEIYVDCPSCSQTTAHCHPDDRAYVEYLEGERARCTREADDVAREINLLQRLIEPELMEDVFKELSIAKLSESQVVGFVQTAHNLKNDYQGYFSLRKKAARLLMETSEAARQLATKILELRRTGIRLPDELRREAKENELHSFSGSTAEASLQFLRFFEDIKKSIEARPQSVNEQKDLRVQLVNIAQELENWPVEFGSDEIDAATNSRQFSHKTTNARAFAAMLNVRGIGMTPPVMRAVALATNIAANDENFTVSEDDVRKALARVKTLRSSKGKRSKAQSRRKTQRSQKA
jgi:hypothetical protein